MGAHSFSDLIQHEGHNVVVVTYGDPAVNVAIECEDCGEVLTDFDAPGWDEFPDTDESEFDEAVSLVLEGNADQRGYDEASAMAAVQAMMDDESGSISTVLAKLRGEQS